jgi:acylphosphatase
MKRFMLLSVSLAILLGAGASADEKPAIVRKHWFISGRVQGVSFRAFAYDAARELKVKGWVRNLTDGRVEIVAEADEKAIAALLAKVKRGPTAAKVEAVTEGKVDAGEKLAEEFEIRDSAAPPKDAPE